MSREQPKALVATVILSICFSMLLPAAGRHDQETPTLTILDPQGRISTSAPSSPTGNTVDVTVGPSGSLTFSPSSVNILAGDTVHWTWASFNHTVTSGSPCTVDSVYCSPNDSNCSTASTSGPPATYSHTFTQAGTFSYFCRIHCGSGMTGTVHVTAPFVTITSVTSDANDLTLTGQTTPNTTVTIRAASDLNTEFQTVGTRTSNASGVFTFSDMSPTMHFYRVTYP